MNGDLLNNNAAEGGNGEEMPAGDDDETTARRAIEYLADHDLVVASTFPTDDPPSVRIREMVEPYLLDAAKEVGDLLVRYTMKCLADDWLGLGRIELPFAEER